MTFRNATMLWIAVYALTGNVLAPIAVSSFVVDSPYTHPCRVERSHIKSRGAWILRSTVEETARNEVVAQKNNPKTRKPSSSGSTSTPRLTVVPPNEGFRATSGSGDEVSIASMNLLAPFYNSLQLKRTTTDYERWEFLHKDRTERVPQALAVAKRTNADVLCLQEIEGGTLADAADNTDTPNATAAVAQFTLRDEIRTWLTEPTTTTIVDEDGNSETVTVEGYDSFVWSPLNPNNKRGDMVGLCIAWRSRKHELVEWEGYTRGMVCRLRQKQPQSSSHETTGPSFGVANLHLPAKPSNVLGRLKTMSRTVAKLSVLDQAMQRERSRGNALHGLLVVAGDFNADQNSVSARLLLHGRINYGNVRDRNYKARITKAEAAGMSHPYRFLDSYEQPPPEFGVSRIESFRQVYAPVTVSLQGRGPGIMDHLFYTTTGLTKSGRKQQQPVSRPMHTTKTSVTPASSLTPTSDADDVLRITLSKRSKRRKKGESRGAGMPVTSTGSSYGSHGSRLRVEALLATVDGIDESSQRLKTILNGLPNLEEGFPSDHLPVGVLFSARSNDRGSDYNAAADPVSKTTEGGMGEPSLEVNPTETEAIPKNDGETTTTSSRGATASTRKSSAISPEVRRRRKASRVSFGHRRRHNVVLNTLMEWLVGRGATSLVLDKPLYKNELLTRSLGTPKLSLSKKSRAPDLVCAVRDARGHNETTLVVLEVAVASDPDKVRAQKVKKYRDLVDLLVKSNQACQLATIVVGDDGTIPAETRSDVRALAELTTDSHSNREEAIDIESDRLCSLLQSIGSSFSTHGGS